ncbi:MAG: hypothetical protein ACFFEN_03165 [Candidatus Thorarchaeota archaeon]
MRSNRTILIIFILFLAVINVIPIVIANPVPMPTIYDIYSIQLTEILFLMFLIFPFLFFMSIVIEYRIYLKIFKSYIRNPSILYKWVYAVNSVTFPLTQITAFLLVRNVSQIPELSFISELIPMILESLLLLIIFKRLTLTGDIRKTQSQKNIIFSAILANLATFVFGILLSLGIIYLYFTNPVQGGYI